MLDCTEEAVASALKRARAALKRLPAVARANAPPPAGSPAEQQLVARLSEAFEAGDVPAIVALLTADVWVTMPPAPL